MMTTLISKSFEIYFTEDEYQIVIKYAKELEQHLIQEAAKFIASKDTTVITTN